MQQREVSCRKTNQGPEECETGHADKDRKNLPIRGIRGIRGRMEKIIAQTRKEKKHLIMAGTPHNTLMPPVDEYEKIRRSDRKEWQECPLKGMHVVVLYIYTTKASEIKNHKKVMSAKMR